jgi:hypothetical protein
MNAILTSGLILLAATLPIGAAQAAGNEPAGKPTTKQEQKRGDARQEAPCPEDPPPRKELKKKSTTKKVEPAEPARKPAP